MFGSFDVALSGMNAAGARMNVAANNIANLDSDQYRPKRANLTDGPDGQGVRVESVSVLPASADDNLANDLVDLKTSEFLYAANAAVVRASDRMLGTLLDVLDHNPADPRDRR